MPALGWKVGLSSRPTALVLALLGALGVLALDQAAGPSRSAAAAHEWLALLGLVSAGSSALVIRRREALLARLGPTERWATELTATVSAYLVPAGLGMAVALLVGSVEDPGPVMIAGFHTCMLAGLLFRLPIRAAGNAALVVLLPILANLLPGSPAGLSLFDVFQGITQDSTVTPVTTGAAFLLANVALLSRQSGT